MFQRLIISIIFNPDEKTNKVLLLSTLVSVCLNTVCNQIGELESGPFNAIRMGCTSLSVDDWLVIALI